MKQIIKFSEHIFLILSKRHFSFRRRMFLLCSYILIRFKRVVKGRAPFVDYRSQNIFGFKVTLDEFREDFYWIFTEIFIDENYYFETDEVSPLIIDCGSNIGISILYFKAIYPEARILAFEPSPDNLEVLRRNLEDNNIENVKIVESALGKEKGELEIYKQGPGTTFYGEFASKQRALKSSQFGEKVKVRVEKLSDYISEKAAYLKLDVEGAEGEILEDLDKNKKLKYIEEIGMEYHLFSKDQNKLSELARILEDSDYDFICSGEAKNFSDSPKKTYKTFMIFAKKA